MAKLTLTDTGSGFNKSKINENFQKIEDELNNKVLYRDNPEGEPNQWITDQDADSQRLLNLPDAVTAGEPLTLRQYVAGAVGQQTIGINKTSTTAIEGQILFTAPAYVQGSNNLNVYVNGVRQNGSAYTETSDTSITFTEGLSAGDVVEMVVNEYPELEGTVGASSVTYGSTSVGTRLDNATHYFPTVAAMQAPSVNYLQIGEVVQIGERANSFWEVIAATTNNGYNILDGTNSSVSLTLKIKNKTVQAEAVGITTALADCKTATEAVLALSEINRIEFGYGTYAFSSLQLVDSQEISGRGREHTKFTFSGTLTQDGVTYSFGCNGGSSPALTDLNQVYGIEMDCTGATGGIGWYISKKVLARDVYVHDADSHGIYWRSVNSGTEAPYFSQLDSCWSKSNGGSGMKVTENCNQNTFVNCLFDSNTEHGVHHQIVSNGQPTALYGNTYISGQASYNELHGFYFQDGSEYSMYNVYNEFNSQTDGGNPKTGAYKNVQLGTNVARCTILLGSQGTSSDIFDAIGLNTNTSNKVHIGNLDGGAYDQLTLGYENVGSGRDISLNGAGGAQHNIYFREGTEDVFRIQYNGAPGNPANELLIQSYNSGAWTTVVKLTNNGRLAFFDATTQQRQTVTGSTGGNAALQSLLTALDNIGLITDSTT